MVKVYGIVLPTWVEHPRPYDNRWIVLFLRPYTWPIFEKNTGHFDVRQYHCKRLSFIEVRNRLAYQLVSGWWFQAIWKILVNGKDYPTYYGKIKKVPNYQPGFIEVHNQLAYQLVMVSMSWSLQPLLSLAMAGQSSSCGRVETNPCFKRAPYHVIS